MTGLGTEAEELQSLSEDMAGGSEVKSREMERQMEKSKLILLIRVTCQQLASSNGLYEQSGVRSKEMGTYLR